MPTTPLTGQEWTAEGLERGLDTRCILSARTGSSEVSLTKGRGKVTNVPTSAYRWGAARAPQPCPPAFQVAEGGWILNLEWGLFLILFNYKEAVVSG